MSEPKTDAGDATDGGRQLIVKYPTGSFAGPFASYVEAVRAGRTKRGNDQFSIRPLDEDAGTASAKSIEERDQRSAG
jgi:hypothetical protein